MEVIHDFPTEASFVPLATHQSQTPESFFGGPPVLYYFSPSAKLSIPSTELALAPALSSLVLDSSSNTNGGVDRVNGETREVVNCDLVVDGVDVWVTSERFVLFSRRKSIGVSIPYPCISLHAIERPSPPNPANLFLQILAQSPTFDDHDPDATVSLCLTPTATASPPISQPAAAEVPDSEDPTEERPPEPIDEFYAALSACANLHPDPATPGSDEGDDDWEVDGEPYTSLGGTGGQQTALPPPMPGSGGWITADNVGEYFDEEGNWRGGSLGDGAGTVRRREDENDGVNSGEDMETTVDEIAEPTAEDEAADGEETKWRRTG